VGKRFGMGKDVVLHIDPDGTLRIENPRRKIGDVRKEIIVPADALESAVIKGNLRLRLVYLDGDNGNPSAATGNTRDSEQNNTVANAATTKRLLEFDTPLHREQFVSVLQRRVAGEEDPQDVSTAAARHLLVRFGSSVSRGPSFQSSSASSSSSFSPSTPHGVHSPSAQLRGATPNTRPRQLTVASSVRSTASTMTATSRASSTPSYVSKRPSLVWTPGGMDTLHPHQASPVRRYSRSSEVFGRVFFAVYFVCMYCHVCGRESGGGGFRR
jgi:hypothetical protein